MGLPAEIHTIFATVAEARARIEDWRASPERSILLTRDIATMLRLAEGHTLAGEEINIGGIHHAPGRHAVLPYVFLSPVETGELRRLAEQDVRVGARDLPASRRFSLEHLVGGRR